MKRNRVLLQATSIIVALVITLYFSYTKVVCAETQEKIVRIIKKFEIKGNQRISTTAIRSSIRVKEGDPYDPQLVSQDVDAILSFGVFDNIKGGLEDLTDWLNVFFFFL